eukprot:GDKI01020616.1.p1 GENE.GDKI01020616.1~~GDKI01020616.1.p1  ORF type:complete len:234 (-),score=50.07 GDKI01020616.1:402-1103(-)
MARHNFSCCCISRSLSSAFGGLMSLRNGMLLTLVWDVLALVQVVPSIYFIRWPILSSPVATVIFLAPPLTALYGVLKKNLVCLQVYFVCQWVMFVCNVCALCVLILLRLSVNSNIKPALKMIMGDDLARVLEQAGPQTVIFVLYMMFMCLGMIKMLRWYILSMLNSLIDIYRADGTGDEYKNAHTLKADSDSPSPPMHQNDVDPMAYTHLPTHTAHTQTQQPAVTQPLPTGTN